MVLSSTEFEVSSILSESLGVDIETADSFGVWVVGEDAANSTKSALGFSIFVVLFWLKVSDVMIEKEVWVSSRWYSSWVTKSGLFEDSEFETCGRSYFQKVAWDDSVDTSPDPKEEKEEEENSRPRKLSVSDLLKKDYYRVLGLEDLKWRATDDQIRSAYRKLVLKYHPDKMADPSAEDREIFLHVQEAYDTLGNIEKRRA